MERLKSILEYRRPHDSEGEDAFVADVLAPYNPTLFKSSTGQRLAYVMDVADAQSVVPPVLWCCHIDTMHDVVNPAVKQHVEYDEGMALFYKKDKDCLGADDGAGIWLMLEMIDAGVPGSYIFHRGEERGGIGSSGMADEYSEWLSRFKWAIAFDRRGTGSVITHQGWGGECASQDFAHALGGALMFASDDLTYEPDATGVFTDTANYTHLIPECTNLSVGYYNEHTQGEYLDAAHLGQLRDALIKAFKTEVALPVARDPKDACDRGYSALSHEFPDWRDANECPQDAEDVVAMDWDNLVDYAASAAPEEIAALLIGMAERCLESEGIGRSTGFDSDGGAVLGMSEQLDIEFSRRYAEVPF